MKKLFFSLIFVALALTAMAQTNVREEQPQFSQNPNAVYRLFPTQNMYNFVKLNTCTGQMEMVQWSTTGREGIYSLSSLNLAPDKAGEIPGRFTLYSTPNIYNFILLDQINGRVWQVQWNFDVDKRGIMRIY